jgi:hypothetical protein
MTKKPLVVALGDPKYAGQEFIDEFKRDFDFEVDRLSESLARREYVWHDADR